MGVLYSSLMVATTMLMCIPGWLNLCTLHAFATSYISIFYHGLAAGTVLIGFNVNLRRKTGSIDVYIQPHLLCTYPSAAAVVLRTRSIYGALFRTFTELMSSIEWA